MNNKKNLIFVNGTMGSGKTTVCRELKTMLMPSVFLDGDWCWDMCPFVVSGETKCMVVDNIVHLLGNFLKCSEYKNIIFCWVMHEQAIVDELLGKLEPLCAEFRIFTLMPNEKALTSRLQKDVDNGLRSEDVIKRSVVRLPLYEKMNTCKIDVSSISAKEAAEIIKKELAGEGLL